MTRPFRVLGLQQVAIGGPSKANLRHLWVDLFGIAATGTCRSERENVDEDILSIAGVEIDLMEPIDPSKSPKVHEPRLNHLGLWVDDLPAAVQWLTEQGVRFTPGGIRTGAEPSSIRSATFCEVLEIKNGRCIRGTTYADSVRLLMDMSQTAASVAA